MRKREREDEEVKRIERENWVVILSCVREREKQQGLRVLNCTREVDEFLTNSYFFSF